MSRTAVAPRKQSLREVLSGKVRPRRTYRMALTDPEPAQQALADAQQEARLAVVRHGSESEQAGEAAAAVAAAQVAVDACWHQIVLYALPAPRFAALMREHPPTKEGRVRGDEWNPDTFQPALIAACAQDDDMTEQEWADELNSDRWPLGHRNALFAEALAVNVGTG